MLGIAHATYRGRVGFLGKEEIRRSGFKKEQHLSTATTFNINPGAEEIGGEVTFKLNFELIQNKFSRLDGIHSAIRWYLMQGKL